MVSCRPLNHCTGVPGQHNEACLQAFGTPLHDSPLRHSPPTGAPLPLPPRQPQLTGRQQTPTTAPPCWRSPPPPPLQRAAALWGGRPSGRGEERAGQRQAGRRPCPSQCGGHTRRRRHLEGGREGRTDGQTDGGRERGSGQVQIETGRVTVNPTWHCVEANLVSLTLHCQPIFALGSIGSVHERQMTAASLPPRMPPLLHTATPQAPISE